MRVMVIVKADRVIEAGGMPSEAILAEMGRFNEALAEAGVLLSGEGLHPSSKGVRVSFPGGTVTDGPFAETKELVAGFWLWKVGSMAEAIDWIRRSPFRSMSDGEVGEIEIRPVLEADDFGEAFTPELREQEERIAGSLARSRST